MAGQVSLVPVDHDPFAPVLTPVDHDPFADVVSYANSLPDPSVPAGTQTLSAYDPSWSERIGAGAQDLMSWLGASKGYSQDFGQKAQTVAGMVPGVGQAISGNEAVRDASAGNYGQAALNVLGALPMMGGAAERAAGEAAPAMKLRTKFWGGEDGGTVHTHTPLEFREVPHVPGTLGGWKFGIDSDGTPWISGSSIPPDKHVTRALQDYLSPLPDGVYLRTAWNKEDYEHLKNGTHLGSNNWAKGTPEAGLSVAKHLELPQRYGYLVKGEQIGTGSDGEPILETATAKPAGPLMPYSKIAEQFELARRDKAAQLGLSLYQLKILRSSGMPVMKPSEYARFLAEGEHSIVDSSMVEGPRR